MGQEIKREPSPDSRIYLKLPDIPAAFMFTVVSQLFRTQMIRLEAGRHSGLWKSRNAFRDHCKGPSDIAER